MFQTIGAYLDALTLIGIGIAGRYYAPRWVRRDGPPAEVERRLRRTRKLATVLLVSGVALMIFRILNI